MGVLILKITELKLKENISLQDKVNVIEETAKACFTVDENMSIVYTPYFKDIVFVAECLRNFFNKSGYNIVDHVDDDGNEVEVSDDVIHAYIHTEGLHQELFDKLRPVMSTDYLLDMVDEKIDFEKQRVILVEQNAILSMVSDKLYDIACNEEIRTLKEIEALDRMNSLTIKAGEHMAFQDKVNDLLPPERQAELAEKLGTGEIELNDVMSATLQEMVNLGHFDEDAKEIIEAKDKIIQDKTAEIIELQKVFAERNKE